MDVNPDQRLKQKLNEMGIKQVELAWALGVDRSYLNLVINGWVTPSELLQERIAHCLQVPENSIFGGNDKE